MSASTERIPLTQIPQDQLKKINTEHLWVNMADVEGILKRTRVGNDTEKSLLYQRLRGMARNKGIDRKASNPPFDSSFLELLETTIGADPNECKELTTEERMRFVISRIEALRKDSIELANRNTRPRIRAIPDDLHLMVRAVLEGIGKRSSTMTLQERVNVNQSLSLNGFEPLNELRL